MMLNYIVNTDALTFLKTLPTDSVDAVITDPLTLKLIVITGGYLKPIGLI